MIVFNNRMIAIVGLLAHILPDNDGGNGAADKELRFQKPV
jgi:hypothetical protein